MFSFSVQLHFLSVDGSITQCRWKCSEHCILPAGRGDYTSNITVASFSH
jgi:hypothetical protein